MNSTGPRPASVGRRLSAARSAAVSSAWVLAVATSLGTPAYWQLGLTGLWVVGMAAAGMMIAIVASNWSEWFWSANGNVLTGLLAATCIRIMVPLAWVLMTVATSTVHPPAQLAFYILPVYLVMLTSETLAAVRRCREANDASESSSYQNSMGSSPHNVPARSTHGI